MTDGQAHTKLSVFEVNTRALAFYVAKGFATLRRTEGDNEEGLADRELILRGPLLGCDGDPPTGSKF